MSVNYWVLQKEWTTSEYSSRMVTLPSPKQVHPLYEILQRCGKELVTREAPNFRYWV